MRGSTRKRSRFLEMTNLKKFKSHVGTNKEKVLSPVAVENHSPQRKEAVTDAPIPTRSIIRQNSWAS